MKRLGVLALALCLFLCACGGLDIPKGYTAASEHFDPAPTQDHTDYCVYVYPQGSAGLFADYTELTAAKADIDNIVGYFENFSGWMDVQGRSGEYDFDPSCINCGDLVRIVTKEGEAISGGSYGKYDNYTVYYFDTDSDTLYYIHSNI